MFGGPVLQEQHGVTEELLSRAVAWKFLQLLLRLPCLSTPSLPFAGCCSAAEERRGRPENPPAARRPLL